MSDMQEFKVWCNKHSRIEYYSLGDLICGAATESNREGDFDGTSWRRKTPYKDKAGVELWEGDVLRIDDPEDESRCVIVFHDGGFCRSYVPFLSQETKEDSDYFEKDYIHHWTNLDSDMWLFERNLYDKV